MWQACGESGQARFSDSVVKEKARGRDRRAQQTRRHPCFTGTAERLPHAPVPGAPLRAGAAHVVKLGAVGMAQRRDHLMALRGECLGTAAEQSKESGQHGGLSQCNLPRTAAKGRVKISQPRESVTRNSQPRQSSLLGRISMERTRPSARAKTSE